MALAKIQDPITGKEIQYHLDTRLKANLDNKIIPSLMKKDKDCFICVDGKEGCQPAGEKVLMADGSWKNIEDIKVGDLVLSPQQDNSQVFSKVLKTTQWFCDEMYDVIELNRKNKKLYSCSYNHLIPLNVRVSPRKNGERNFKKDNYWKVKNYQASYFNSLGKVFKLNTTTLLSPPIEHFLGRKNCEVEPYTLGIWLGDGHFSSIRKKVENPICGKSTIVSEHFRNFKSGEKSLIKEHSIEREKISHRNITYRNVGITTMDIEVIKEIKKYYNVMSIAGKKENLASTYRFSITGKLAKQLIKYRLDGKGSGTKFIPDEVFTSDIEYRKKLLAGLMDSDGYYSKRSNSYEITIKSKALAEGIYKITRSLGYRGSIRPVKKKIKSINFVGDYFHVNFYVGEDKLPVLLDRKTGNGSTFYLSSNRTSINVVPSESKMVYGFTLDSESSLYITEDYIVTHNSGKSTIALQIGKYVDPTLDLNRIVFDAESFRQAIFKAKKGQCVVFDEAFTGLSSRAALSGVNKTLVSLMMQMRQKNLMVIMVLPTFFMLDKYAALFRAKALIHVYENKGVRGYFRLYNSKLKKILYLKGKKDYSYSHKYVRTMFKGRFYGKFALGSDELEKKYRKKKEKALQDTEKDPMTSRQIKYRNQRDISIYLLRKTTKLTYREIENLLQDYDFNISHQQINKICSAFGDKENEKPIIERELIVKGEELDKNDDIIPENDENVSENDDFE